MRTCIKSWRSLTFGQIGPLTMELTALERLKISQTYNGKMVSPSKLIHFLIGSSSNLLVTRTAIKSQTSSNSGWIESVTSELHAHKGQIKFSIDILWNLQVQLTFQTLEIFVTLFSGTVRPRRLKLGTHVNSGQMYHVYWNQAAAEYLSLYFFIFLSLQFSTLKFLVTLFSGTVRPRRLKLGTHMDRGQMYHVYRNQAAAAAYLSLYFFIFLSLQFSTLQFFITLFSGTLRSRRLKLGTHIDSGQMYHVYQNQAAAAYSSLYFFIFLSLQFSNIKIFVTHFSGTVRPRRLKLWYKCG